MKKLFSIGIVFMAIGLLGSCNGQTNSSEANRDNKADKVGGTFENSEFTYYGIPRVISATDTSSGWGQNGQKLLLTGVVYKADGKTPAPGVLIYYYQTDTDGRYIHKPGEKRSMPPNENGQTHGYIRGWVKTDSQGRYFIYTVRPGVYPTRDAPAHVHVTVKEPNNINEYYIDDFVFSDDELVDSAYRSKMENRCGNGELRLVQRGNLFVGERNLTLGLNIPDYPR